MTKRLNLERLVRENIKKLKPYSSARDEHSGAANLLLDANESPFGIYNRYPDPNQGKLKEKIAQIKNSSTQRIFIGNGSDEAIDLLFKIFCQPGKDRVIICPPTYGMYEVCANVHDVQVTEIPLTPSFTLDTNALLQAFREPAKLLFLCSPNNPTGNSIPPDTLEKIINAFPGIVVLDEAYSDFSPYPSFVNRIAAFDNLVVLQTLSKGGGLAAVRIGMAFAQESIITYLHKVKFPYNVSEVAQQIALSHLEKTSRTQEEVQLILEQKAVLSQQLSGYPFVRKIYPSDANFLLVKTENAASLYHHLSTHGIVVRNRSTQYGCNNCIRITIGSAQENKILLNAFKTYQLENIVY